MEFKKIIECNERYDIVQWEYDNMPITFRFWKVYDKIIEIRVNDYFARANGYKSVEDMVAKTVGKAKFEEMFGGVPDWIRATPDGEFIFVGVKKTLLN